MAELSQMQIPFNMYETHIIGVFYNALFDSEIIKIVGMVKNTNMHLNPLSHELIRFTDFDQIRYPKVFGVVDYESEIRFFKFKMAAVKSRILSISLILCLLRFLGSFVCVCVWGGGHLWGIVNVKLYFQKFKMADPI